MILDRIAARALARALLASAVLCAAGSVFAGDAPYSPHVGETHATTVYWGDTHVHSSWSPDAGGSGNRKLGPDEAYRFARGETITGHAGEPVALRRPLDFLVLADHSEALGLFPLLQERDPTLLATENGRRWSALLEQGRWGEVGLDFALGLASGRNPFGTPEARAKLSRSIWDRVVANADRYNQPGVFTAFIGYEWSSMPGGANLHRIVVFRDGAERAGKVVPFSSVDSEDPEDLWRYLADYEAQTGGNALAIPHNSNLSAGRMFELVDFRGRPLTRAYAEARRRWEPVVEATQIKGDSEAAPRLSPDDEFADFGTWDGGRGMAPDGKHEDWMYEGEYVRPALGNGLALATSLGTNPFQLGMIGSTDSHTGLATADDDDFWGKFSSNEPPVRKLEGNWAGFEVDPDSELGKRMRSLTGGDLPDQSATWSLVASGYAAVWARENTRGAIFDAIERRETYATTGPRLTLRFFGGWQFRDADANAPDLARAGYAKGVPMGGTLGPRSGRGAPGFLVAALRDPEGANLDRLQVVKLWIDAGGKRRERIFDVAVSGDRQIGADGRCRTPVGSTVDLAAATWQNTLGAAQLASFWRDPEFDPALPALYYVRVLQIPTPHWTVYDAVRLGAELPERAPREIQERAYTSPIWYTPAP
jgi:hypothetical protein